MNTQSPDHKSTFHEDSCNPDRFERTQWSLILKARDEGAPGAESAMDEFARRYWPCLYRFIRRRGYSHHDAEDLTQSFYHHFQEKHLLSRVEEHRGRFRNYLLTCLKHFLSDEHDKRSAEKRGGKTQFIARDALEAEERDALEPADELTADQVFARRWGRIILDTAVARLQDEYTKKGLRTLYDALKELPSGGTPDASYAEIALRLGKSESAIKSAANQLKNRWRMILREEVGRTVCRREDIDDEIRFLSTCWGTVTS